MTKIICRTTIVVIIALTMLAGSALAYLVDSDAWFEGESSAILFGTGGKTDIIANIDDAINGYYVGIDFSSVIFDSGDGLFNFGAGAGLSDYVEFQFRGGDAFDVLVDFNGTDGSSLYRAEFNPFELDYVIDFGTIDGFTFTADTIDYVEFWIYNGNPGFDIYLNGWVNGKIEAYYYIELEFNEGSWDVGFSIDSAINPNLLDGGEVPEPGTLLLLGTGVVGLGLIARRRMSKK